MKLSTSERLAWLYLLVGVLTGAAGPDCDHPPVWPQLLPDAAGAGAGAVTHRSPRLPAGEVRPHQCAG